MEQGNQSTGGNAGTRTNPNPAAATAGKTGTFRANMVPRERATLAAAAVVVASKPRTGSNERRDAEGDWDLLGGEVVLPEGTAEMLAEMAEAERADEEQEEDAEVAAKILESAAEAQAASAVKETQADAEKRLGRKVAERDSGEPDKTNDMGFWRGWFGGKQDSPMSSEHECGLHEDCGSEELAHIVVTTARLRDPHVITVCWKGKVSFYAVVDELNAERDKPLRFSSFVKLEDAEAKAAALAAQWGIGRRVGGKAERTGTTSEDEAKAKGRGRRKARRTHDEDDRPIGSISFDPAWYTPCVIEESPYLIEYHLRRQAQEIRGRASKPSGPAGVKLHDFLTVFSAEKLRVVRKRAMIERRAALAKVKLEKLDTQTPTAKQLVEQREKCLRAQKYRKMALRGWQKRRGEQVTVQVTLAEIAKPVEQKKPTKRSRRRTTNPVYRGRYVMFNRRTHTPSREVQIGWSSYSDDLRKRMLLAMGQDVYGSPIPQRGVAVACKKKSDGGKKG